MKSLLLIVGFALALAASGKKKECGYTVVRGPTPSECDKRWKIPWSGNSYGFLYYHNWPMKMTFNSQHGWVSNMADCGSRQHGVLCAKDQL
ncbi:unnamed protein product [Nippostrongylus brasiliensis]|uniref:8.9 kDa basic salivary peptide n=1 Tax=Nippostrongylus brasiliensis TaxID=27835 RepID=A0A0N4YH40_NIPBR|nr:unnamed protein product [Nippostrongylus brasiliensis]